MRRRALPISAAAVAVAALFIAARERLRRLQLLRRLPSASDATVLCPSCGRRSSVDNLACPYCYTSFTAG